MNTPAIKGNMKKQPGNFKQVFATFILALAMTFMSGAFLSSCQTSDQKVDEAQAEVADANQDLEAAQNDANVAAQEAENEAVEEAQKVASADEWKTFKTESEAKIKENETQIADLKAKMKKPGKILDGLYAKNIEALEEKNKDLKNRIDAYEKSQSDWSSFKREFSHDMDELGKALKDLTVNNKN